MAIEFEVWKLTNGEIESLFKGQTADTYSVVHLNEPKGAIAWSGDDIPVATVNIEGLNSLQFYVHPEAPVSLELPEINDGVPQKGTRGYALDIVRINLLPSPIRS